MISECLASVAHWNKSYSIIHHIRLQNFTNMYTRVYTQQRKIHSSAGRNHHNFTKGSVALGIHVLKWNYIKTEPLTFLCTFPENRGFKGQLRQFNVFAIIFHHVDACSPNTLLGDFHICSWHGNNHCKLLQSSDRFESSKHFTNEWYRFFHQLRPCCALMWRTMLCPLHSPTSFITCRL